jgi:hypothetical protein
MNLLGLEKQIEVVEQEDGLLIKAIRIRRVVDQVIPIAVCVGLAYMAWRDHSWLLSFGSMLALGVTVRDWFLNDESELRITDKEILASGYLGGWSRDYVRFRWVDISGLDYRQGAEDELIGLYARTGRWNATCVMAGLNREQAEEVIATVFRRFPYVVMAEDDDGWSLFGTGSQMTTLGLSKPKS